MNTEKFKTQLMDLAKMAYISFYHLKEEFQENAKTADALDSQRDVSSEDLKEVSITFEDLKEVSITSDDLKDVSATSENLKDVSNCSEDLKEVSTTSEDLKDDSNTSADLKEVFATSEDLKAVSITPEEQSEAESEISNTSYFWFSEKESPVLNSRILGSEMSDSITDDSQMSVSTKKGAQDIQVNSDPFISSILKTIRKVAPNLSYKPKHLRRKKFKVVPFEFAAVWRNLPDIFSDVETRTKQDNIYPEVCWERVSKGALRKIPTPSRFPVHSVSSDPAFYTNCKFEVPQNIYCSHKPAQFKKDNPFGFIWGFQTSLGIIKVPDEPVSGHVWDHVLGDWVLHAESPSLSQHRPSQLRSSRRSSSSGSCFTSRRRTRGRPRRNRRG